jgi:hypothetical protein
VIQSSLSVSDTVVAAIIGAIGTILAAILAFAIGKRYEKRRQTMRTRAEMLRPIEEWLGGAELMVSILAVTVASVSANSPLPLMYSLDERRKAAQFMSEKTNVVIGILESNSLQTWQTRKLAKELSKTILAIDSLVKYQVLPLDNQVLEETRNGLLPPQLVMKVANLKRQADSQTQNAHKLIAKLKTTFV